MKLNYKRLQNLGWLDYWACLGIIRIVCDSRDDDGPYTIRHALHWKLEPSPAIPFYTGPTPCHNSLTLWGKWSVSLSQTDIWSHTCSMEFMPRFSAGQYTTSTSNCSRKQFRVQYEVGHCLERTQRCIQRLELPRVATSPAESQCSRGSLCCNPKPPSHCSSHEGWHPHYQCKTMMSINWLRKIVNHPLPLRTSATVVMIQKDVGLVTEYTVPPIHEVPPLVLTAPLPVKSPMLQCQHRTSTGRNGRYPTVKILLMIHLVVSHPPNSRIMSIIRRKAEI